MCHGVVAGIEHTQDLLKQALTELEAAREREEGLLKQRTANLQQEHAAKMAELERGFLMQVRQDEYNFMVGPLPPRQ